jgi:hypothetical protein
LQSSPENSWKQAVLHEIYNEQNTYKLHKEHTLKANEIYNEQNTYKLHKEHTLKAISATHFGHLM